LSITVSLASHVLSLSTEACYGHSVSPSGAFFGEWRFSRRTLLLVLLSFVCLASSSESLNPYAIFPNNYISLASIRRPYSANSMALTTFHNVPGQSFAFESIAGFEPTVDGSIKPLHYRYAILRTYFDVLPQLLHILLDTEYNTPTAFRLADYSTSLQVSGA
jgi:hypothetical protein